MFSLFKKDPAKELQKEYEKIMKKAVDAQRNGDIDGYSRLCAEAESIANEIDSLAVNVGQS